MSMHMRDIGKIPMRADKIRNDTSCTHVTDRNHQAAYSNTAERDRCTSCIKARCNDCIEEERKARYKKVADSKVEKFYCTFGDGQPNGGCVLPITATDELQVRLYMHEMYDGRWCGTYTEEYWNSWKEKALLNHIPIELELPPVNIVTWKPKGE